MTERSIAPRRLEKYIEKMLDRDERFTPLAHKTETLVEILRDIPVRCYSLPLIGLNAIRRLFEDVMSLFSKENTKPLLFLRHTHRRDDLERTVELIIKRRDILTRTVGRYVFLAIPAKQTNYANDVDPHTRNFIPNLVAALKKRGVEAVDLTTAFQRERDRGLYFPFDTHWNATGAAIAAQEIARQVFGKGNDNPSP